MGQRFEDLNEDGLSRFYLQYSFPPFSVGEVGRTGPPGRREVGHGKLAERALLALIPPKEKFSYTDIFIKRVFFHQHRSMMSLKQQCTICYTCRIFYTCTRLHMNTYKIY